MKKIAQRLFENLGSHIDDAINYRRNITMEWIIEGVMLIFVDVVLTAVIYDRI